MECKFCKNKKMYISDDIKLYIDKQGVLCIDYEASDGWYGFDIDTTWTHCPYCGKKLR